MLLGYLIYLHSMQCTILTQTVDTLAILKDEIDSVADEIGGVLRGVPWPTCSIVSSGEFLISLQAAKLKLHDAKGVIEEQKQSNLRLGSQLEKKYQALARQALNFNANTQRNNQVDCPLSDKVKSMPSDDTFWDFGSVTHPNEPWVIDPKVQLGTTLQAKLPKW
ncbi:uncharacterized protein MELLADRAFT_103165 [Melampsora larici-populina 98AG31]|uniref:Uncharacterized protein n=1 Tax=Melampsora larici-populina (strain 98AG31 / pathotype 3-4-7) TaxID=747676 RepID=F4RAR7_MELLP|nr:uncharacterized protein MELLADRAFT_103165 [Melampsora larici-populina 98AG31]EGG10733.1 hypothetical protein MELLADRAFT_103165 [Melampsora larici-populina 98AG31]